MSVRFRPPAPTILSTCRVSLRVLFLFISSRYTKLRNHCLFWLTRFSFFLPGTALVLAGPLCLNQSNGLDIAFQYRSVIDQPQAGDWRSFNRSRLSRRQSRQSSPPCTVTFSGSLIIPSLSNSAIHTSTSQLLYMGRLSRDRSLEVGDSSRR